MVIKHLAQRIGIISIVVSYADHTERIDVVPERTLEKCAQREPLVTDRGVEIEQKIGIGIPDNGLIGGRNALYAIEILINDLTLIVITILHVAIEEIHRLSFPHQIQLIAEERIADRAAENILALRKRQDFRTVQREVDPEIPFHSLVDDTGIELNLDSGVADRSDVAQCRRITARPRHLDIIKQVRRLFMVIIGRQTNPVVKKGQINTDI